MQNPPPTPTTDADPSGVPTWPAWRIAYALWQGATDWHTRWSAVKLAGRELRKRLAAELGID